jgi:hypothetical protein
MMHFGVHCGDKLAQEMASRPMTLKLLASEREALQRMQLGDGSVQVPAPPVRVAPIPDESLDIELSEALTSLSDSYSNFVNLIESQDVREQEILEHLEKQFALAYSDLRQAR